MKSCKDASMILIAIVILGITATLIVTTWFGVVLPKLDETRKQVPIHNADDRVVLGIPYFAEYEIPGIVWWNDNGTLEECTIPAGASFTPTAKSTGQWILREGPDIIRIRVTWYEEEGLHIAWIPIQAFLDALIDPRG